MENYKSRLEPSASPARSPSPDPNLIPRQTLASTRAPAAELDGSIGDTCLECKRVEKWLTTHRPPTMWIKFNHVLSSSSCRLCQFFVAACHAAGRTDDVTNRTFTIYTFGTAANYLFIPAKHPRVREIFESSPPYFDLHLSDDERRAWPVGHVLIRHLGGYSKRPVVSPRQLQVDRFEDDVVRGWLKICDTAHINTCGISPHMPASLRGLKVIDCLERVILPFDNNVPFVTLSYVWGSAKEGCHVLGNQIPHQPPKVIADAIRVTRMLGFRYLWVDRYCIPQENAEEKRVQIQHMGTIYAASSLTIIAAAGTGPERGLPGVNGALRAQQLRTQISHSELIFRGRDVCAPITSSVWNSRGWTLQEGLLSRRRLVFTETEVYFQCLSMQCMEGVSVPLQDLHGYVEPHDYVDGIRNHIHHRIFPSIRDHPKHPGPLLSLISNFMKRRLTDDSDAIDAVRGIFSFFANSILQVRHVCGLPIFSPDYFPTNPWKSPTSQFAAALEWGDVNDLVRRPKFPSWSWAGWKLLSSEYAPGEALIFYTLGDLGQSMEYLQPNMAISTKIQFLVQIQVEFDFGVLDAETELPRVLDLSDAGEIPRCLRIRGWTFKVPIMRNSRKISKTFCWSVFFPEHLRGGPKSDERSTTGEDTVFQALGLVLSVCRAYERLEPRSDVGFLVVQLRENTGTFERVDYLRAAHNPEEVDRFLDATTTRSLSDRQHLGGLDLEYAEICLA
jgi:hypothetical protein